MLRMTTAQTLSRDLADVVNAAVRAAHLSQRDLAERTGIPLVTLNRRLTARTPFTVTELAAIAEALGDVSVTDWFLKAERMRNAAA